MLINLRNALMSGKRLPYDAEVEYLESTGTQYIKTGVYTTGPMTFRLSATFTPTWSENDFFGACTAQKNGNVVCGIYGTFAFGFNNPNPRINSAELGSAKMYADIEYALGESSRTLTVNRTTYSGTGATYNTANEVLVFRANPAANGAMKLHAFQILDAQGTLVRDYIPVRKGTVGYLYDRVTGKLFGNAGTGDFMLGQDVVPVEYIESHGTEWIDTGIIPSNLTRFDVDMALTAVPTAFNACGTYKTNPTQRFNVGAGATAYNVSYGADKSISATVDTARHYYSIDAPNLRWAFDNTTGTYTSIGSVTFPKPLYLFARSSYTGAAENKASIRLYKSDIYTNGVIAQKSLPVRVGTEGALIDTLTRRIYRNAGTGAFGYGNDLKYPIPSE